nr:MAG TPA: hypothetical protein [Caudoviricetes sp.]
MKVLGHLVQVPHSILIEVGGDGSVFTGGWRRDDLEQVAGLTESGESGFDTTLLEFGVHYRFLSLVHYRGCTGCEEKEPYPLWVEVGVRFEIRLY